MWQILTAIAPFATAISRLLEVGRKVEEGKLTQAQMEKEIAKITNWVQDSERTDREFFATADKKRRNKGL